MNNVPFISCLCPTYKRPALLANAVACFLAQEHPPDRRKLYILDDAGQFEDQTGDGWQLVSTTERYPTLPAKFDALARMATGDLIAIWEDDDIFLRHHLSSIAAAYASGGRFIVTREVFSNYGRPEGLVRRENAAGRFHSSWAFTRELYAEVGGYPKTSELIFDQQMGARLRQAAGDAVRHSDDIAGPSYVYRWGNGVYHGSAAGGAGYADLWQQLGEVPAEFVGWLVPRFDDETERIYSVVTDAKKAARTDEE
ncbi:MAG: glycosyltransferase [Planctomycetota bacterium]|nr:MAG: glycosyltransferase [Planctomycetota bacterium]REJ95973.1 MAG: glycosyltransferase [Planctomycetota bacterium]REK21528.1 MAG: glycosyltransferase [Planctomycetota bacterium]REK39917.1 MAG: glycosyltransferase [Planctomycetota bacterium]